MTNLLQRMPTSSGLALLHKPITYRLIRAARVKRFFKKFNFRMRPSDHQNSFNSLTFNLPAGRVSSSIGQHYNAASNLKTRLMLLPALLSKGGPQDCCCTVDFFRLIAFSLEVAFFMGSPALSSALFKILISEFYLVKSEIRDRALLFKNQDRVGRLLKEFTLLTFLLGFRKRRRRKASRRKKRPARLKVFAANKKKKKEEQHKKRHLVVEHLKKHIVRLNRWQRRPYSNKYGRRLNKKKTRSRRAPSSRGGVRWPTYRFFAKLVSVTTKRGHRKRAMKLLMDSLNSAKRQLGVRVPALKILDFIYRKIHPFFLLRKFSFGRRSVLIPLPLRGEKKRISASARMFMDAVRRRGEPSLKARLREEFKAFMLKVGQPATLKARGARVRLAHESRGNLRFLRRHRKRRR